MLSKLMGSDGALVALSDWNPLPLPQQHTRAGWGVSALSEYQWFCLIPDPSSFPSVQVLFRQSNMYNLAFCLTDQSDLAFCGFGIKLEFTISRRGVRD